MRDQIADDLKLFDVIVSNFNIEAIFNRNHQLDAVEKVSAEIVNKMGFACYKTGLDVEMFRDEKANIVQGMLLRQLRAEPMPILPLPCLSPLLLSGSITQPSKRFGFEAATKKIANVVMLTVEGGQILPAHSVALALETLTGAILTVRTVHRFDHKAGGRRLLAHPEQTPRRERRFVCAR